MKCPFCEYDVPDDAFVCPNCWCQVSVQLFYNPKVSAPKHPIFGDNTHGEDIKNYKSLMGFKYNDENFVFTKLHYKYGRRKVYEESHDILLTFEPSGILCIGVTSEKKTFFNGKFSKYSFYLNGHNSFIDQGHIESIKIDDQTKVKIVTIRTKYSIKHFVVEPFWHARLFQGKNFYRLRELANITENTL